MSLVTAITDFTPPPGALALWHINQFGYGLKAHTPDGETVTAYIDLYLSDDLVDATRGRPDQHTKLFEPPFAGSEVTNADYVFCTHDHLDHLDPTAVAAIADASPAARFVVPNHARPTMRRLGIDDARIDFVQAGERYEVGPFVLHTFAGQHEAYDRNDLGYAYLGYHLAIDGFNLYHAGDTILFDELVDAVKQHPVDVAMLPINGREYQKHRAGIMGNMNFKEAAEFAVELGADIVIPGHWGQHAENTERPGHFVDYLASHHPTQKMRIMVPGDRLIYMRG